MSSVQLNTPLISTNGTENLNPDYQKLTKACQVLTPDSISSKRLDNEINQFGIGFFAGSVMSYLSSSLGFSTAIHEVVGHGLIGMHLTHDYTADNSPTYQVDGWDNFKSMVNAPTFLEKMQGFGRWLTGYDAGNDGRAGYAQMNSNVPPNGLGNAMGKEGLRAWISISGSIPGLILNSAAVAGGMKIKDSEPVLGYSLVTLGLMEHLMSSFYPISAAAMSQTNLVQEAAKGHDFANFAVQIGNITQVSPTHVAIGTATAWTLFVPLVALGVYLYQKAHETEFVPDHIALQEWLLQAQKKPETAALLEEYLNIYPRKEQLLHSSLVQGEGTDQTEAVHFVEYLLDTIPKRSLDAAKKKVLKKWEKLQVTDNIQKAFSIINIIGTIGVIAAKVFDILGQTIAPVLTTVGSALAYASPFFTVVSVIASGYETYKDFKTPDGQIPKAAKMISVAKLIVTIASAIGITVAMFVPGLNVLLISSMVIGLVAGIILAYARSQLIQNHFLLLQSLDPNYSQLMEKRFQLYNETHIDTNELENNRKYYSLKMWLENQRKAQSKNLLTSERVSKLTALGVLISP